MTTFRTQYDDHSRVLQNPGDPEKQLYSPIFDKKGVMHLEPAGVENLYDYIQSHAQSVDIHVLLQQYERGDLAALSRVQGTYGDFTQMPTTFAEALNTLIAAEQYFDGLPVDVRAKFGHNFTTFIASMDTADFARSIGLDLPTADDLKPSAPGSVPASPAVAQPSASSPASTPQPAAPASDAQ